MVGEPPLQYPAPHLPMAPHMQQHEAMLAYDNDTNTSTTVATPTDGTTVTPAGLTNSSHIPCHWILYVEVNHSGVRLWDVIILIPNVLFLLFLLIRVKTAISKLQHSGSPTFVTFYGLIFLIAVISVLRCVVSMTVSATAGAIADDVMWLILCFFMLAVELSVVTFGLAFGHLDTRTSIQRVLGVTFTIALAFSVTQGVLEFKYRDPNIDPDIFGHGGMPFWFATSIFFCLIYCVICFLPFTSLRHWFALPAKKSFYFYCLFLALVNMTEAVGSGLLYYEQEKGMCVLAVSEYLYFTFYTPIAYYTFLKDFFKTSQTSNILFSYKAQVDDALEEDTVSLPHQMYNSAKLEVDIASASYDSTHFDHYSPNPLYSTSPTLNPSEMAMVVEFSDDSPTGHKQPNFTNA